MPSVTPTPMIGAQSVLTFELTRKYSRADVKEQAGFPRNAKGGNWDTGIVEHGKEFLIFANVGTKGRTGHDYGNQWVGSYLRWYHRSGSHLAWESVQRLLERRRVVHVFWRISNEAPFDYAGTAKALEVVDVSPVEILWSFDVVDAREPLVQSPEEATRGDY